MIGLFLSLFNFILIFKSFSFPLIEDDHLQHPTEIIDKNFGPNLISMLQVEIGSPPQTLFLKMSSAFCGIYVLDRSIFGRGYTPIASASFEKVMMNIDLVKYKGEIIAENIRISTFSLVKIPIFLINSAEKEFTDYDGFIGFGYQCDIPKTISSQYSIDVMRYLIKSNDQKSFKAKKVFFFQPTPDEPSKFFLAFYPVEKTQIKKFYYKTILLTENKLDHQWKFKLDSVYITDSELIGDLPAFIKLDATVSIGLTGAFIAADKKFFDFIVWKFFLDGNLNFIDSCWEQGGDTHQIFCDETFDIKSLGVFHFIVGKWNFKIKSEDLFYKVNKFSTTYNWLSIINSEKIEGWYISQKLIKNSFIIFDEEENEIAMIKYHHP